MIVVYIFAHILICSLSIEGCNSVDSSMEKELPNNCSAATQVVQKSKKLIR